MPDDTPAGAPARPDAPDAPDLPHRRGVRSTAANARLTGITGITLLVLLAAQGLTIPGVRAKLGWHVFIGFLLIPPVLIKAASTGYRAVRYYTGDPDYRAAGPPRPLLRVLAPLVVLLTLAVLATGVALVAGGHQHLGWLVAAHKLSFLLWFAVMTVHVLAYVWRAAGLAWAELTDRVGAPGRRLRLGLVAVSVAGGVALAVATRGWASGWHRQRDGQVAGRPAASQAANASQRSANGHQSQSAPVRPGKSHAS